MSAQLSEEERNLLQLFGSQLCEADHGILCYCQYADVIDDFIAAFNADPATYRQDVREPMMSDAPFYRERLLH